MKKILSLLLAGLMTALVFAVGASAAAAKTEETPIGTKENEHYTGVTADKIADAGKTGSSDINVKVETVTHMYAVDITYSFADISLGDLKWDVDNLKYVQDDAATAKKAADQTRELNIQNRSDMEVKASVSVAKTEGNQVLDFVVDTENFQSNAEVTINKATTNTAVNQKVEFTAKPATDKTWADVIEHYGPQFAHQANIANAQVTFATVTVTLKKA